MMSMRRGFGLAFLLTLGLAISHSRNQACAGNDPNTASPEFVVRTCEGQTLKGALEGVGGKCTVTLKGARTWTLAGPEWLWLRRLDRPVPEPPREKLLMLANGDRIPAVLLGGDSERLRVRPAGWKTEKEWNVPLTVVRGYWFGTPPATDDPEKLQWRWERERRPSDRLMLRNLDVIEGIWEQATSDTVRCRATRGVESVPRDRLAAIGFSTRLPTPHAPDSNGVRLILVDGTRLTLKDLKLNDTGQLVGESPHGMSVTVPLSDLIWLEPRYGQAVHLSDLEPVAQISGASLDVAWPAVRDASVMGRRLRLGRDVWDKGLGMHGGGEVTYQLDGKYQALEAWVGLDARSGRGGSARVEILVDGQVRYASPELTAGQPPLEVRVELREAKKLTLRTLVGRGGNVKDHVNWGNPRLITSR